jgi:catechol 2,3-dioxygenase-like lactoylglutathione lyase family enzyme
MAVTVSAMFIPVHDLDAALGFYRDALGLEVRNDVASDGFRRAAKNSCHGERNDVTYGRK